MTGPPAAIAAVRAAVRHSLDDLPPGTTVLVACSGGPDSVALAAALAFTGVRAGLRCGLLTVDHAWYDGSAAQAASVATLGRDLGLDPVEVLDAPSRRSEGAARDARRAALLDAARCHGASAVLLGHTLDDQAETVLLRLARGSGARSMAGMPRRDGLIRRPLLDLRRTVTVAACEAAGLTCWDDPTNSDPAFARARVRHRILPLLEDELGPGIAESLARSADLLRADADALDDDAALALERALVPGKASAQGQTSVPGQATVLDVGALAAMSAAVRGRVLRHAALDAGCAPAALTSVHIRSLDDLVTRWRGQRPVPLPSGVQAARGAGRITVSAVGAVRAASTVASENAEPPGR